LVGDRAEGPALADLAFAFPAILVALVVPSHLGAVPDQEAGVARELVRGLRDDLDDEFFSDDLAAWNAKSVSIIGCV
jgi:hypothetical protein